MKKNILSLDLGKGSLGLAISRSGQFVSPLTNIRFHHSDYDEAVSLLLKEIKDEKIEHIVIGYPLYPSGDPCEMTNIVEQFILKIAPLFPGIDIIKVDERYSTLEASNIMLNNNKSAKKQKKNIDSAAAMVILERHLKDINQY